MSLYPPCGVRFVVIDVGMLLIPPGHQACIVYLEDAVHTLLVKNPSVHGFLPPISVRCLQCFAYAPGVRQLRKMNAARQPGRECDWRVIDAFTIISDEQSVTTPISAMLEASNTTIACPTPPSRMQRPPWIIQHMGDIMYGWSNTTIVTVRVAAGSHNNAVAGSAPMVQSSLVHMPPRKTNDQSQVLRCRRCVYHVGVSCWHPHWRWHMHLHWYSLR